MKLLFKILWKDQSRSHLLWAILGTMAGFVLLLSGIHFYENMKQVLQSNQDLIDPEYIIINKKVNIGKTLGLGSLGFSEEEIKEIEMQPFTNKVATFISNEFPVSAHTQNKQFPNFYTELFFEAVPDEYIDVKSDEWNWNDKKRYIPVILPQDYLNLYNFGFSQSQGLPQIPKEMISMIRFNVVLKGLDESKTYPGKIIGFSNRINSILVPYKFLSWANEKYGYLDKTKPSRIILLSNDPTDPAIIQFIEKKGYDTIREKLKSSRLNIILKFVLSFLVIIAGIIIALAFLVFLLSLQLMISRSSEKIRRLHKLGFHPFEISLPYLMVLFVLLIIVTSSSIGITSILAEKFAERGMEWTIQIDPGLSSNIYYIASAMVILLFILNALSILISTKRLCKN